MYFLLAGAARCSVALYCASVCALCAARCGACVRRGLASKKVQGWRKGAGSKIAVGPPIPIYIASDRIPSQHVSVGLAQARPNDAIRTAQALRGRGFAFGSEVKMATRELTGLDCSWSMLAVAVCLPEAKTSKFQASKFEGTSISRVSLTDLDLAQTSQLGETLQLLLISVVSHEVHRHSHACPTPPKALHRSFLPTTESRRELPCRTRLCHSRRGATTLEGS